MGVSDALRAKAAAIKTDANFSRVGRGAVAGAAMVHAGVDHYLSRKLPVASWMPVYVPLWLASDVLAGVSTGMVLFPQMLVLAAMSGASGQTLLRSSWLPSIVTACLSTSRDASVAPLLFPTLVVAGTIEAVSTAAVAEAEAAGATAAQAAAAAPAAALIVAALTLAVGAWSLVLGLLNLGCVFDALSVPVVLGFTGGLAIVSYMGQVTTLFGMAGVHPLLVQFVQDFVANLTRTNGAALGLGLGCVVFLAAMQKLHTRYGRRHVALRLFFEGRNLIVLGFGTAISFGVNRSRGDHPLWLSVGSSGSILGSVSLVPTGLSFSLVEGLFLSSFMLFLGIAFQHIVVAKAMGRTGGYAVDCSQELVVLGVANLANAAIGGYPVGGGDMGRTGVLRTSGVRSPLAGLVVAAVVASGMGLASVASGFMDWIPLPAAAAVLIVTVIQAAPSPADMVLYWRWSFADFITFLLSFNVTLITTPTMGLEVGGGLLAIYTLVRLFSARPRTVPVFGPSSVLPPSCQGCPGCPGAPHTDILDMSNGILVVRLENDLMCANAERVQQRIVDLAMTRYTGSALPSDRFERAWNDRTDLRVEYLRRRAVIPGDGRWLPHLRCVVIDMTAVGFIDSSGLHALQGIKSVLRAYSRNDDVQFRFAGLQPAVQARFRRSGWNLVRCEGNADVQNNQSIQHDHKKKKTKGNDTSSNSGAPDYVFDFLHTAVRWPLKSQTSSAINPFADPITVSAPAPPPPPPPPPPPLEAVAPSHGTSTYSRYSKSCGGSQHRRYSNGNYPGAIVVSELPVEKDDDSDTMFDQSRRHEPYSPIALRELV